MRFLLVFTVFVFLLTGCDVFLPPAEIPAETVEAPPPTETPLPPATLAPDPTDAPPVEAEAGNEVAPGEEAPTPVVLETPTAALFARPENQPVHSASVPFWYVIQAGTPLGLQHPAYLECNWMGVGGQVFGVDGGMVENVIIYTWGTIDNQPVSNVTTVGSAPQWGPSGFEIQLADHPIASKDTLWLQLYDAEWHLVSNQVRLETYGECERNFVMINFSQLRYETLRFTYLPLIYK